MKRIEREQSVSMKASVPSGLPAGCLIYDSHCRVCVAVKQKLEQTRLSGQTEFVPYASQKARERLGPRYQPGQRPPMAYWVDERGTVVGGLEAFLPLTTGLRVGNVFMFFWRFRVCRVTLLTLYKLVATHRYRWFGASDETSLTEKPASAHGSIENRRE